MEVKGALFFKYQPGLGNPSSYMPESNIIFNGLSLISWLDPLSILLKIEN